MQGSSRRRQDPMVRKSLDRLRHRSENNEHLWHSSGVIADWLTPAPLWALTNDDDDEVGFRRVRSHSPKRASCSSERIQGKISVSAFRNARHSSAMERRLEVNPISAAILSPISAFSTSVPRTAAAADVHQFDRSVAEFFTPDQTVSCVTSRTGRKSTSRAPASTVGAGGTVMDHQRNLPPTVASLTASLETIKDSPKQIRKETSDFSDALSALRRPEFLSEDVDSFGTSKYYSDAGEVWCVKRRYPSASSAISSDDNGNANDDDRYESPDILEEPCSVDAGAGGLVCGVNKGLFEAKIAAWNELRARDLMMKLKKEEEAITEWQRKMTTKAKMEMKEYESKLEAMRSRAMMKMQKKVIRVEKEAKLKKEKEKAATAKKIHKKNTRTLALAILLCS